MRYAYKFGPTSVTTDTSFAQEISPDFIAQMGKEFESAIQKEICTNVAQTFLNEHGSLFGTGPVAVDGPTANVLVETLLIRYLEWLNTEGYISDENFITKE